MINELGGVVAENTKMEMLATHFIAVLPNDTFTGMMVCALATGKWLIHVNFIYDSFRCKKFLPVCVDSLSVFRHEILLLITSLFPQVQIAFNGLSQRNPCIFRDKK